MRILWKSSWLLLTLSGHAWDWKASPKLQVPIEAPIRSKVGYFIGILAFSNHKLLTYFFRETVSHPYTTMTVWQDCCRKSRFPTFTASS
jgi:hypothetical protein